LTFDLSRAIEDLFKEGEPVNTQRGIKANAHAKQLGKIVRPADEHAEFRKSTIYDLGKLVTISEVLRACKLNQDGSHRASNKMAVLRRFHGYLEQHCPGSTIHDEISVVTMNKFFLWVHKQA
jgi:hypothetical protein